MLNKETVNKIWEKINSSKRVTIATHVDCDGDTIGAGIALKHLILENTSDIEVKISGEPYPRYLNFLENNDEVSDEYFNDSLKIVVDTSTPSRIHDKRVVPKESIKIDHHHAESEWLLEIGGDHWPATGQLLFEIAEALDLKLNDRAKDAIFVCIWTDTDKMTQRNISDKTWEVLKACSDNKDKLLNDMELSPEEIKHIDLLNEQLIVKSNVGFIITEDIVPNDYIRQMTGILSNRKDFEVYFGVTKVSENSYRGELRSKCKVDVSKFAKLFGGGGHFASSGFKCNSIDQAKKNLEMMISTLEDNPNN